VIGQRLAQLERALEDRHRRALSIAMQLDRPSCRSAIDSVGEPDASQIAIARWK